MLLKALGIVMMLDGALSAMSALPKISTFVYRSWRDESLIAAHFLVGALLLLSGRLLFGNRDRELFRNNSRSLFLPGSTLVAALAVAAIETTRFDWPALALRVAYTVIALAVLYRTTLPKT